MKTTQKHLDDLDRVKREIYKSVEENLAELSKRDSFPLSKIYDLSRENALLSKLGVNLEDMLEEIQSVRNTT